MSIIISKNGKRVYKTYGYMSYEDKKIADKIDIMLKEEVPNIEERLTNLGLFSYKRRSGSIKLWHGVGLELRKLWIKVQKTFDLPDTFLTFFIKAVYDNSNEFRLMSGRSTRFKNSYLYYCYIIAGYELEDIERTGNWTEWVEFLDSKRIRDDPRITRWFASQAIKKLGKNSSYNRLSWFRRITRAIRNELKDIDTRILGEVELNQKLDRILKSVVNYIESSENTVS